MSNFAYLTGWYVDKVEIYRACKTTFNNLTTNKLTFIAECKGRLYQNTSANFSRNNMAAANDKMNKLCTDVCVPIRSGDTLIIYRGFYLGNNVDELAPERYIAGLPIKFYAPVGALLPIQHQEVLCTYQEYEGDESKNLEGVPPAFDGTNYH